MGKMIIDEGVRTVIGMLVSGLYFRIIISRHSIKPDMFVIFCKGHGFGLQPKLKIIGVVFNYLKFSGNQ